MSALTVRLPDDKHRRLKELSRQRKVSVSRLIDEMTTLMLLISMQKPVSS